MPRILMRAGTLWSKEGIETHLKSLWILVASPQLQANKAFLRGPGGVGHSCTLHLQAHDG